MTHAENTDFTQTIIDMRIMSLFHMVNSTTPPPSRDNVRHMCLQLRLSLEREFPFLPKINQRKQ